ncbi:MAG: hypothetical protein JNJ97_10605, partial [Alphaproteobacteria bacterium]|nr:hypothetical protein [Alphaproteobacteria bacterium]
MNWQWRARLRDWGTLAAAVAKVYGPIALLIAAGFYVAFRFVAPPPPNTLRFAAGAEGGSYAAFAERYAQILARDGVKVEILRTAGALENLHMLSGGENRADAGFVQGGVGSEEGSPGVAVLATVFHEPVWLMVRADLRVTKLADM